MSKTPEIEKKDRFLIIFYVLYFSWLLLTTYFSTENYYNNVLVVVVTVLYFIFLNETFDLFLFTAATAISYFVLGKLNGYPDIQLSLDYLKTLPLWIYVSWGFTAVALRKLFSIISKRVEI